MLRYQLKLGVRDSTKIVAHSTNGIEGRPTAIVRDKLHLSPARTGIHDSSEWQCHFKKNSEFFRVF